jgi:hypothetical protein
MFLKTNLSLTPADLEDTIAALCMIASVAHLLGDQPRRDAAIDLAAEMAEDRTAHSWPR